MSHAPLARLTPADAAGIRALVSAAGLPLSGLEPLVWPGVVARAGGGVIGCALVESYEDIGLLRSVAVAPPARGQGIGEALVAGAEEIARELGLTGLVLLTETAARFFARRGFLPLARPHVPPAVQVSPEFKSICPASAQAMARPVARPDSTAAPLTRAATEADCQRIAAICHESRGLDSSPDPGRPCTARDVRAWFDGRHPILVIEEAGRVEAFAAAGPDVAGARADGVAVCAVGQSRAARGRGLDETVTAAFVAAATSAGFRAVVPAAVNWR